MRPRIIDRPSEALSEAECREINRRLREIHVAALPTAAPVRSFTDAGALILSETEEGHILGFLTVDILATGEDQTLYLNASFTAKECRMSAGYPGLIAAYLRHARSRHRLRYLCFRTQSPVVHRWHIRRFAMFPNPTAAPDPGLQSVARDSARHVFEHHTVFRSSHGFLFEAETLIMRRAYGWTDATTGLERGRSLYGDAIPWCRTTATDDLAVWVNDFHRRQIDQDNGDAVFMIGRLPEPPAN